MSHKRPNQHLQELWLIEVEDEKDCTKFRYRIKARYTVNDPGAQPVRTLGAPEGYRGLRAAVQRTQKIARKAEWKRTRFPVFVGDIQVGWSDGSPLRKEQAA